MNPSIESRVGSQRKYRSRKGGVEGGGRAKGKVLAGGAYCSSREIPLLWTAVKIGEILLKLVSSANKIDIV